MSVEVAHSLVAAAFVNALVSFPPQPSRRAAHPGVRAPRRAATDRRPLQDAAGTAELARERPQQQVAPVRRDGRAMRGAHQELRAAAVVTDKQQQQQATTTTATEALNNC